MTVQAIDGVHGDHITKIFASVNGADEDNPSAIFFVNRYGQSMGIYEQILAKFQEKEPNMSALAEKARISHDQVRNFYKGMNVGVKSVAAMLEAVGARVEWPDERKETVREVVFANPKLVNVPPGAPAPIPHNYLAVPLVGWSGAGSGVDDPIELDGNYLMVLRNHPSIRTRSDLIGVKIAKWETSMSPLMNPGDIIVVDRRDIYDDPSPPGNIYLVCDPASPGGVMIKLVIFQESLKGNLDIVFYSENASKHPPMVHNYEHVFSSDIEKAIVGRVVVCFSDMTDK